MFFFVSYYVEIECYFLNNRRNFMDIDKISYVKVYKTR